MENNKPKNNNRPAGKRTSFKGKNNRERKPFVRRESEFIEKVVDLRRVTRVMAGGKRFRFRTTIIIGDGKSRVGVGMGKGQDVVQSINKAKNDAKKKLFTVRLDKNTIPHEVDAKFSAARVILKPAKEGNGLVAGGAVRIVLALAGVKDVTAKCLGNTTNKVTNALATIKALKSLKSKSEKKVALKKKVEENKAEEEVEETK